MDKKILTVVSTFLDKGCRVSDSELSDELDIPQSSVSRYLTGKRTVELIGIKNFAYIKKEREKNKILARKKGGLNRNG